MYFISKSRILTVISISILLFASCKRSSNVSPYFTSDDNGGYASDASRIELINNDVISLADAAGNYYNSAYISGCATVATDTVSIPHTIIIRFSNTDCMGLDGRNRRGAIIITYNGQYTDSSKLHTITFNNYYINDNQLTGSIQMTRVDTTVAGNWYYRVKANDSLTSIDKSFNSSIIAWNGSLVRRWVNGYNTGDRTDDVFSISGSATLTRANSHSFSFNIATPLQFALNCDYAESGVADIVAGSATRILNYGAGSCDPYAQVTLGEDNSVFNVILTK